MYVIAHRRAIVTSYALLAESEMVACVGEARQSNAPYPTLPTDGEDVGRQGRRAGQWAAGGLQVVVTLGEEGLGYGTALRVVGS